MPTNYRFIKKDGKAAKLPDVDREICEWYNQEQNKSEYSQSYLFVTMSGIAILSRVSPKETIEEKDVDKFCDEVHSGVYKELLKEFLVRKYTFKAWWSGK